jgi:hypothetical protein
MHFLFYISSNAARRCARPEFLQHWSFPANGAVSLEVRFAILQPLTAPVPHKLAHVPPDVACARRARRFLMCPLLACASPRAHGRYLPPAPILKNWTPCPCWPPPGWPQGLLLPCLPGGGPGGVSSLLALVLPISELEDHEVPLLA